MDRSSASTARRRSRFFDHVELSRQRLLGRTYKRDREGKFATTGGDGGVADLPRMDHPSVQQAAEDTNPNYGSTAGEGQPTYRTAARAGQHWNPDLGPPPSGAYEENCTNCTQAFEMRMRGYDVAAAPMHRLDQYGYAAGRTGREIDEQLAASWRAPGGAAHGRSLASQEFRSFDEIDREVKGWPEGGRGFVYTSRHVFSVVKSGGKAQYIEPQYAATPSRVVTREYRRKFGSQDIAGSGRREAKVIRLDDLEPADGILEVVVPA